MSLALPEHSITALVGPNGAGKSTLVRACVGFEPANEGRILVNGHDVASDRALAVASIGYVPQNASLYRPLTVADHFAMAVAARPSFDRSLAVEMITSAGLTERRRLGELSGGEQAQVALALALGARAPLLLLDEPLASLDPLARRDLMTLLVADVRGRGATALVSSHIITDVEQACDRMAILVAGQLVLHCSIADAKSRFATVPASQVDGATTIGTFSGPDGESLALVSAPARGRPASLEEIVLGHLAQSKRAGPH